MGQIIRLYIERVSAGVALTLIAIAGVETTQMPVDAALFPRLVLGASALLVLAWLAGTFGSRAEPVATPEDANPARFSMFVGLTALFILGLDQFGFFTATLVFIPTAAMALGFRRWWVLAAATIGLCSVLYLTFVLVFHHPLPPEFFQ